jgi:hypothetical protein
MTLRRRLGTLEMAWRWFDYKAVLFSLGLVFLVTIQALEALGQINIENYDGLGRIVLPLATLGLTYVVAAFWLNTTFIVVGPDRITVRYRPVPSPGEKDLLIADILQLFAREEITKARDDDESDTSNFQVRVITRDRAVVVLVPNLRNAEQARFIEQEIERHLGIEDEAVPEEIGRAKG